MKAVEQLMGAYFHQDWDIDGGQVSDTVAAFLHEPRDTVLAAADQIDELIGMNLPEGGLVTLLESMGCQYYAGESDADYREWLGGVLGQLRSYLATSAAS